MAHKFMPLLIVTLLLISSAETGAADGVPTVAWVASSSGPGAVQDFEGDVWERGNGEIVWGHTTRGDSFLLTIETFTAAGVPISSNLVKMGAAGQTRLAEDQAGHTYFLTAMMNGSSSDYTDYMVSQGEIGKEGNRLEGNASARRGAVTTGDVAIDAGGNLVVAVPFRGMILNGETYYGHLQDIAILKFKPDGLMDWMQSAVGNGQSASIALDARGAIYVAGKAETTIAFGGTILNLPNGTRGYVAKYSPGGNVQWARPVVTPFSADSVEAIAVTDEGNWISGTTTTAASWPNYTPDISSYLAAVGDSGTITNFTWIPGVQVARMVAAPSGNLILAGTFSGGVRVGEQAIQSRGNADIFVAEVGPAGRFHWFKSMGYIYDDAAGNLRLDRAGDIYVTGAAIGGLSYDDQYVGSRSYRVTFLMKLAVPQNSAPVLATPLVAQTILTNGSASFSAEVMGTRKVHYQWYRNDQPLAGGTGATLQIRNARESDAGQYRVEVWNEAGTNQTEAVDLIVLTGPPVLVTTVVGTNVAGWLDATNTGPVRFNQPNGIHDWTNGVVAVADAQNHLIRAFTPGGGSMTVAGQGVPGYVDKPGRSAKFNTPLGLYADSAGIIYVADTENNVIRRIDPFRTNAVSTVAGGGRGYADGWRTFAQFNFPNDLVGDALGNLLVTEFNNHTVRKISPGGDVITWAGNGSAGFRDGVGTNAMFSAPAGITIDDQQNLYVTEWGNHSIRKITPDGLVTTVVGSGGAGFIDGPPQVAKLNRPDGITVDPQGNLYFVENGNHAVRKCDRQGNVSTLAGLGRPGFVDGDKAHALFNAPGGITWHQDGTLLVADTLNHSIRRLEFVSPAELVPAELTITLNPALQIRGAPGATYDIQAAEEGSAGEPLDWASVTRIKLSNAVENWYDPQPATRHRRLYRAVQVD